MLCFNFIAESTDFSSEGSEGEDEQRSNRASVLHALNLPFCKPPPFTV